MDENEKIKNLFISQRQALGFTQTDVGAVIGASKSSYSRYEHVGFGGISYSDFLKICKKLELDPFKLQGVVENEKKATRTEVEICADLLGCLGYTVETNGDRILLYDDNQCPLWDFDSAAFIQNIKIYADFIVNYLTSNK